MPNFGNPSDNVVVQPLAGQPIRQGYAVITVLPTGGVRDLAPACSGVNILTPDQCGALWNSRLLASGETSIVTR